MKKSEQKMLRDDWFWGMLAVFLLISLFISSKAIQGLIGWHNIFSMKYIILSLSLNSLMIVGIILIAYLKKIGVYLYVISLIANFLLGFYYNIYDTFIFFTLFIVISLVGLKIYPNWKAYA